MGERAVVAVNSLKNILKNNHTLSGEEQCSFTFILNCRDKAKLFEWHQLVEFI